MACDLFGERRTLFGDVATTGVLPRERLLALAYGARKVLAAPGGLVDAQFQPASMDLRLGARAWRVRAGFLAGTGRRVEQDVDALAQGEPLDLREPQVLKRGAIYVVEAMERLVRPLPADLRAFASPRSSTGRIDVFVRLVVDGGDRFDALPLRYQGPLYLEVASRSFDVVARQGMRLAQLRFRRLDPVPPPREEVRSFLAEGAGAVPKVEDNAILLTPNLAAVWRAREGVSAVLDPEREGGYDPREWWERVPVEPSGHVVLEPRRFYLVMSHESLRVPSHWAAEMEAYHPMLGELRAHYAGFFDPGFGMTGGGSQVAMEVRVLDAPFALRAGQSLARVAYERMAEEPERVYGAGAGASYQGQRTPFARCFAPL